MADKTIGVSNEIYQKLKERKENQTYNQYFETLMKIDRLYKYILTDKFWKVRNADSIKDKEEDLRELQELLEGQKLAHSPKEEGILSKKVIKEIDELKRKLLTLRFNHTHDFYNVSKERLLEHDPELEKAFEENPEFEEFIDNFPEAELLKEDYDILEKIPREKAVERFDMMKKADNILDEIHKRMFIACRNAGLIPRDADFTAKSDKEIRKEKERREEQRLKIKAEEEGYLNVVLLTGKSKDEIDKKKLKEEKKQSRKRLKDKYGEDVEINVYTGEEAKKEDIEPDYVTDISLLFIDKATDVRQEKEGK